MLKLLIFSDLLIETKEVQPVDRIENWMIKIFPKSKENVLKVSELNDQDNITNEARESRMVIIGLIMAMIICLVISGQIIQIYIIFGNSQIMVEPKLPEMINVFCKYLEIITIHR